MRRGKEKWQRGTGARGSGISCSVTGITGLISTGPQAVCRLGLRTMCDATTYESRIVSTCRVGWPGRPLSDSAAGTVQRSSFTDLLNWELEPGNQRRVAPTASLRASCESDERVSHSATGSLAPSAAPRLDITQESWEVSRVFLGFTGSSYSVNRWRTFATIWDAVILSVVSTPTMRPPAGSCSMRFLSSPFASPGPKIRTASAPLTCAATRS